ncbi:MAG TPA: HDOD domain-containing protein, partial [Syntrophales bacterium]|nr:HDOD domain-containing protein [Syntrophales bacterium]HPQ06688.1 HDOD domain-containing protein [Syntrophales bacterium]
MIEKMLLSIKKLPPFPAAARKVAELLRNDDYSVGEVANVIKYDQAIAANILKICNSAYFGARQRISSIPEAVIYLGQKQLLRAVETASAGRIFARGNPGYGIKPKDLWRHSVAVALMSQILSRRIANKENPVLYTAALLHDVGKLILGTFVEGSYRRITEVMAERACSFLEAEEEVLGINHAELGGRIAVYWNFPAEIHDAIAFHHRPDLMAAGETTLA